MKRSGILDVFTKKVVPEPVEICITLKSGFKYTEKCIKYNWNESTGTLVLFKGNQFARKKKIKNCVLHVEQFPQKRSRPGVSRGGLLPRAPGEE